MSVQNTTPLPTGQVGEPARSPRVGHSTPWPYAAVPHDLVSDTRLKPLDVRLVAVLLRYARSKSSCWPSVATLATDLGRCARTVQYALRRLTDAGWIASQPDDNRTGRLIVLVWRSELHPPVQRPVTHAPHTVAPEGEKKEKDKPADTGPEGPPPARAKTEAETPMTLDERQAMLKAMGLLDLPAGHPLAHLATRRPWGEPGTSPAVGLTISVKSWRPS